MGDYGKELCISRHRAESLWKIKNRSEKIFIFRINSNETKPLVAMNKISRPSFLANRKLSWLIFLLSTAVFLYYFLTKFIFTDVYKFAVVGAVYEFLWLPMLLLLVVAPVVSILILVNRRGKEGLALVSILLIAAAIIIVAK
jgi:hypothetical protein